MMSGAGSMDSVGYETYGDVGAGDVNYDGGYESVDTFNLEMTAVLITKTNIEP